MKIKSVFALLSLFVFSTAAFAQSVVITSKKTTYTRRKPSYDYKKTFTINYPKVKAATATLSRKIETTIDYEKNFGFSLREELGEAQWLEDADYAVIYNKNGILTINLFLEGSGAYPSTASKTLVVDLKTGNQIKAAAVFTNINGLISRIKLIQKEKIKANFDDRKTDPNFSEDRQYLEDQSKLADFKAGDLDHFSVDEKGVTFLYDYGFPHVAEALEPEGNYFMSWAEIKPFVKRTGLLGKFVR